MTLYGPILFLHVLFAILLVGGSAYSHVSLALIPRARSVDGVRSHAMWLHVLVKATAPFAGAVLATGLYLTFAGRWWDAGWPVVSLVLFTLAGVTATTLIDPRVTRLRTRIAEMSEGQLPAETAAGLVDPTLARAGWILLGTDMTIVFLMTNKPGWIGSMVAGVVGITLGAAGSAVADRRRRLRTPAPRPPAPATKRCRPHPALRASIDGDRQVARRTSTAGDHHLAHRLSRRRPRERSRRRHHRRPRCPVRPGTEHPDRGRTR